MLKLAGVVPPMLTPLNSDESLDGEGVERLVEHMLDGGVHGLFLLGTTGEAVSLPYQVRRRLIEQTCEQVGDRAPVLVGVTDTSLHESLELAESAHAAGAAAVVLAPPYYLPIEDVQLEQYVLRFCKASPLPVVLYNIPSCTRIGFDLLTLQRCREFPNVIGFKDSSGDLDFFAEVLAAFRDDPDFSVLMGPEEKLAHAVLSGADGGVCGGANLAPQLFVQMYEAAASGDREQAMSLQAISLEIVEAIYRVGPFWPTSIMQGLKAALEIYGVIQRYTAPPIEPLDDADLKQIRAACRLIFPERAMAGA